jgi:hypothetical protein
VGKEKRIMNKGGGNLEVNKKAMAIKRNTNVRSRTAISICTIGDVNCFNYVQ